MDVNFFCADINDYEITEEYDIIFSSGIFHYLKPERREKFIQNLKEITNLNGIHAINVFVEKPFIKVAPDSEESELLNEPWYSGELMQYYHEWLFKKYEEEISDYNSGGIPHQHCVNRMIAENILG